jgi:ankyrin repeat protein
MNGLLQAIRDGNCLHVHDILQTNTIDLSNEDAPFLLAIDTHRVEIFRVLLEHDPNIKDRCNRLIETKVYTGRQHSTLLGLIDCNDYSEMGTCLLENGADPNLRDRNGRTPLYNAIISHSDGMVSTLLQYGADITVKVNGELPLITAIKYGRSSAIKMMLDSKDYIPEYNHCNALFHAVETEYIDIIKLLTQYFNVNERNRNGNTPLHRAVKQLYSYINDEFKHHMLDIIKTLLEAGADPGIANNKGITPKMMASELEALFELYEMPIKEPEE